MEHTSLEVSKRLAEAGFEAEPSAYWQEWPDKGLGWSIGTYDIYATIHIPAYRADTLLMVLMSRGFFSKRSATIQIAYRAVKVGEALDPISSTSVRQDEKWVGHYFVTAFNGSEQEIGQGEALTVPDSFAEEILTVLEMNK